VDHLQARPFSPRSVSSPTDQNANAFSDSCAAHQTKTHGIGEEEMEEQDQANQSWPQRGHGKEEARAGRFQLDSDNALPSVHWAGAGAGWSAHCVVPNASGILQSAPTAASGVFGSDRERAE